MPHSNLLVLGISCNPLNGSDGLPGVLFLQMYVTILLLFMSLVPCISSQYPSLSSCAALNMHCLYFFVLLDTCIFNLCRYMDLGVVREGGPVVQGGTYSCHPLDVDL